MLHYFFSPSRWSLIAYEYETLPNSFLIGIRSSKLTKVSLTKLCLKLQNLPVALRNEALKSQCTKDGVWNPHSRNGLRLSLLWVQDCLLDGFLCPIFAKPRCDGRCCWSLWTSWSWWSSMFVAGILATRKRWWSPKYASSSAKRFKLQNWKASTCFNWRDASPAFKTKARTWIHGA